MRRLCYALFLLPSLLFAQAAFDVSFQQVNAAGTEFEEKLVNPVASSLAGFDAAREISNVTIGSGLTLVAGALSNPGTTTTLNAILAATGSNTIASGNNTGQVWNWANTTNSTTAFTFGETTAATNGTNPAGAPNQVLLKLSTLATSTMSPLSVYSRGSHVFSVNPAVPQVNFVDGTVGLPSISFLGGNTGVYKPDSSSMAFSVNGTGRVRLTDSVGWGYLAVTLTGTDVPATASGLIVAGNNRTDLSSIVVVQASSSDPALDWIASKRSRGTLASPTVITTGDNLLTIGAHGYVGATNTYLPAAQILFDSTGTIADSTTGIGGQIKFYTTLAGTDTTPQLGATIEGGSTPKIISVGPVIHAAYTVATLPAAANYTYGIVAVSDATDAAGTNLGVAPTGGGAVVRMVYSDGANWLLL